MRKKGEITSSMLLALLGLIIAVVVFFIFLDFGSTLMSSFTKDPKVELAKGNFNALTNWIQESLESTEDYYVIAGNPLTIPEGFAIVGYDAGDKNYASFTTEGGVKYDETLHKPKVCQDKACLVLYKDMNGINDISTVPANDDKIKNTVLTNVEDKLVTYRVYDNVKQISGAFNDNSNNLLPGNTGYQKDDKDQFFKDFSTVKGTEAENLLKSETLMLEGKYSYSVSDSSENTYWRVNNMYVEKYVKDSNSNNPQIHIYIAKATANTNKRYLLLKPMIEFQKVVSLFKNTQLMRGEQIFSPIQFKTKSNPLFLPCYCGEVNLNLPPNAFIKASIKGSSNSPLKDTTTLELIQKETDGTETILGSEQVYFGAIREFKDTPFYFHDSQLYTSDGFILPNKLNCYLINGEPVITQQGEKLSTILDECTSFDTTKEGHESSRAKDLFGEFYDAYSFYTPLNFKGDKCVMGQIVFSEKSPNAPNYITSMPNDYAITINKDGKQNLELITGKDKNVIDTIRNPTSGKICLTDSSLTEDLVDEYTYEGSLLPALRPLDQYNLKFILINGKTCISKKTTGVTVDTPFCDWKPRLTSDNQAKKTYTDFLSCIDDLMTGKSQECKITKGSLPTDYSIFIRKSPSSFSKSVISLHKMGYVVLEIEKDYPICTMRFSSVNGAVPRPDMDIETYIISPKSDVKFMNSNGICLDLTG